MDGKHLEKGGLLEKKGRLRRSFETMDGSDGHLRRIFKPGMV